MPGDSPRFQFQCLRCRSVLEARADQSGARGMCPSCGGVFQVPAYDGRSGLAGSHADPGDDGELPAPVHAYAAAGDHAPKIARREDDSLVIVCPRCSREAPITADGCPSCGVPFTIEGATGSARAASDSSLPGWAMGMGIIAVLSCFCPAVGLLPAGMAVLLAIMSYDSRARKLPGMALLGLVLGMLAGVISVVTLMAM